MPATYRAPEPFYTDSGACDWCGLRLVPDRNDDGSVVAADCPDGCMEPCSDLSAETHAARTDGSYCDECEDLYCEDHLVRGERLLCRDCDARERHAQALAESRERVTCAFCGKSTETHRPIEYYTGGGFWYCRSCEVVACIDCIYPGDRMVSDEGGVYCLACDQPGCRECSVPGSQPRRCAEHAAQEVA